MNVVVSSYTAERNTRRGSGVWEVAPSKSAPRPAATGMASRLSAAASVLRGRRVTRSGVQISDLGDAMDCGGDGGDEVHRVRVAHQVDHLLGRLLIRGLRADTSGVMRAWGRGGCRHGCDVVRVGPRGIESAPWISRCRPACPSQRRWACRHARRPRPSAGRSTCTRKRGRDGERHATVVLVRDCIEAGY